jgi:hypothetical protein
MPCVLERLFDDTCSTYGLSSDICCKFDIMPFIYVSVMNFNLVTFNQMPMGILTFYKLARILMTFATILQQ